MLIPEENEKDLEEIPAEVRKKMTFHLIKTMDEVLELALLTPVGEGITPSSGGSESELHSSPVAH